MDIGTLRQRQSLPLEMKIQKSIRVIEDFYDLHDGNVYISTGGADSSVLKWVADQSTKKIECVCVGGCEPTGNIKLNHSRGDKILKPVFIKRKGREKPELATKRWVITNYGYPLINKDVAMKISRYTRTKHDWVKERRLKGYMGRNGKWIHDSMIPYKYQLLVTAPFEFSEKCCDYTKKRPLHDYERINKKYAITGEMAEESFARQMEYLKHGCISTSTARPKCTPLGFWTEQDIKECILKYNIPVSSEYGEVIKNKDGKYKFTGEHRTGCDICGFGIMHDEERFERLKKNKPAVYNHMMNGGKWIRKDLYRWVKFRTDSIPIWSNLYWVPSDEGFGYRFVLNYFYKAMKIDRRV